MVTLMIDLGGTVILYRLFGKAGLQVAIATAIILANLQSPKLTVIFGMQTSLGVIFYSSIFFATAGFGCVTTSRPWVRRLWIPWSTPWSPGGVS